MQSANAYRRDIARLLQFRVKDFRAYREETTIDFPESGLVLVSGPNNSGKSALLSALDVVASGQMPNALRHAAGSQAMLWVRFRFTHDERAALIGSSSAKALAQIERGALEWIEWEYAEEHGMLRPNAVRAPWLDGQQIALMEKTSQDNNSFQVTNPITKLSEWDLSSYNTTVFANPVPPDHMETLRSLHWQGQPLPILQSWRNGYFHFSPLHQTDSDTRAANAVERLSPDGSNLIDVLHYMRSNQETAWQELQKLIQEFVPDVGTLQLPAAASNLWAAFRDDNIPGHMHSLKSLGTGVEQLLMTLVVGLTQTATAIVLEEPETGLHPAAQRALLGLMQKWSQDRLIVASTHSSTMLDWTSPSTTIISVTRAGANSTAVTVPRQRTEALGLLRELGVRPSDVLTAERVLIIEGPTEKEVFDIWFEETMRSPRLVLLQGEGGYNASHADLFANWLDGVDALAQRKVLYVRDRNELSTSFLNKFEKSERVKLLPCREFENLLLDYTALAAVINQEREAQGRDAITVELVERKAREVADGLKNLVVLKRTLADFADPIRLVDNKSRSKVAKGSHTVEAAVATLTQPVPDRAKVEEEARAAWAKHEAGVSDEWEAGWSRVAPGDELLNSIFKEFLGRGYKKVLDGPIIAHEMSEAPVYLKSLLDEFMAD
ncbi:AAA family ATPase [Actinospica durhamensis]|uniref:AAA family ATPase n=1 Tax=Actinospica durhamensis TaxID=1508375 RepID=A0A941INT0_9ACTN|nr:AAA family ATPase [Actinospica durhamensis]MBR7835755.1 AAA family ATPase [Actinospica durhamensis]